MHEIATWVLNNTKWLYTRIFENPIFFIDYWSFAHLWSGVVIFAILQILKVRRIWIVLFLLLFSYEVAEISFRYFALNVFLPETIKDQFTDMAVGMLGGSLAKYFFNKIGNSKGKIKNRFSIQNISAFFTAATISFIWVGNYQYKYNIEFLNTEGLNIWAFLLWFTSIFLIVKLFFLVKKFVNNFWITLFSTWLIYFIGMLIVEFVGHYVIGIREISKANSQTLVFNLVHGTKALFVFYLSVPFLSMSFHYVTIKTFSEAILKGKFRLFLSPKNNANFQLDTREYSDFKIPFGLLKKQRNEQKL